MSPDITFHDHIKELRTRFLWVFAAASLSGVLGYVLRARILTMLQHPLGAPLYYTSPAGSFNFVLKLSMIIGVFIALPVLVYHLLRFIEPALPIRISRGLMAKLIGSSFLLAVAGICFGFFLMIPMSLHFFLGYSSDQIKPLITAQEYLSFVLNHLLTFALAFQIPMIFLFINRIKPLKPSKLLKYQRHVIVGAFAMALVLPFTYDPLSQFIVAIPIVFLYYLSIIILWIANRGKSYEPDAKPQNIAPVPVSQPVAAQAPRPLMPMPAAPVATPITMGRRQFAMDGFVRSAVPTVQTINRPNPTHSKVETMRAPSQPHRPISRPRLSVDGMLPPLATSI